MSSPSSTHCPTASPAVPQPHLQGPKQAESSGDAGCAGLHAVSITDDFLKAHFPQIAESHVLVECLSPHSAGHPDPCVLGANAAAPYDTFTSIEIDASDVDSIGHATDPLAVLTDSWWLSYFLLHGLPVWTDGATCDASNVPMSAHDQFVSALFTLSAQAPPLLSEPTAPVPPIDAALLAAQVPVPAELELLLQSTECNTGAADQSMGDVRMQLEATRNVALKASGDALPESAVIQNTQEEEEEAEVTDGTESDSDDGKSTPEPHVVLTTLNGVHFVSAGTRQNKLRYSNLPAVVCVPDNCTVPDPLTSVKRKCLKERNRYDSSLSRVRRAALMHFLDEECVALYATLKRVAPQEAARFRRPQQKKQKRKQKRRE
ncbi:hypothetical protein AMAG_14673 [Allomyces macrogynus ATCC 38327]|uniref:Uncharacterized protein n=1 Tax=Allomyces macrogynus (strain ATCC 38327) TaxID=578462 RepID=A0A0L0T790_ALLM3|nr:hypothetical protein AMAG_14673 [Allomyces macrogynus ATCC 38327]|eukprot:KNE70551.1 hypothetical protein AMAG_14673 [Allomyces macrogynus ATCC 38327]